MQMNDLTSAESVKYLKLISLTDLLCSLGSEGLNRLASVYPENENSRTLYNFLEEFYRSIYK